MDTGLVDCARDFEAVRIARFEHGGNDFFGGAGIGGAFENDQLIEMHIGSDGSDCAS